jgi:hypothetical protein
MIARCREPLELAVLVDYWFGELPPPDQDHLEEHVLDCGECSARLQDLVAIGEGVRRLAPQGAFRVVVSPSFLEAASRQGLRVREYKVPPGGRVACTVTLDDDLIVSRLRGDFREVSRLDLVTQAEDGPERRIENLPIVPSSQELIVAQSMPYLRAIMGSCVTRIRLLAHEPGGDRLVGEYTFAHTPSGK